MGITGIDTQSFVQALSTDTQNRKEIGTVKSDDEARSKPKGQLELRAAAPIQDQVTLSKEAQEQSASNSNTLKNSTCQQSPSPFDR